MVMSAQHNTNRHLNEDVNDSVSTPVSADVIADVIADVSADVSTDVIADVSDIKRTESVAGRSIRERTGSRNELSLREEPWQGTGFCVVGVVFGCFRVLSCFFW